MGSIPAGNSLQSSNDWWDHCCFLDIYKDGISRDEFNTVEIDEIVNVILYAYQGIRMWSRIVKMFPVVFDSITNYIRKQLVKE